MNPNDNQHEAVARIVAKNCYAFGGYAPEGSERYDCSEWEDMGKLAREVYMATAADIHTLYASRIEVLTEALREAGRGFSVFAEELEDATQQRWAERHERKIDATLAGDPQ